MNSSNTDASYEDSPQLEYIRMMLIQAKVCKFHGTLEFKMVAGEPVFCNKVEKFKIPGGKPLTNNTE